MDATVLFIISLLSLGVTLLALRWALSITAIVSQLQKQTDLLEILAKRAIAGTPGVSSTVQSIDLGVSSDDHLNSIRATQLHELKKRFEAGTLSEADYLTERSKLML